jgi:hypothetical protein
MTLYKFGGECRQSVVLPIRPAIFDRYVLSLDIAALAEALHKRLYEIAVWLQGGGVQEADHRHRRLLRVRRDRPPQCYPAKKRDELASLHG